MAESIKEDTPTGDDAGISNADMDEIAPQPEDKSPVPRKKRRMGPWLFLLLIFAGLPVAWLYAPPEVRQQLMAMLDQSTQHTAPAVTPPAAAPATAAQPEVIPTEAANPPEEAASEAASEPGTPDNETAPEPAVADTPEIASPESPPSVDNRAELQAEIARLQDELNSSRSEQAQLTQQLKSPPQTIELRVWLGLLASPDTRLLQRALMWSYLASRPALDDAGQKTATDMAEQLKQSRARLAGLRNELKKLAAEIPESAQQDVIPKPANPYFAWLAGTFHLRHAPSRVEEQQIGLRQQLLDVEHALGIEDWPEPRAWRRLAGAIADQFGEATAPDLNETLDDIRMDVEASRKAASDWMEKL